MKSTAIHLGGLVSGVAACALMLPVIAGAAESDHPRTITVSGQGEIQAEPDRAVISLGIESRKLKMEEARAEVTKVVDAVLKLTRELKIDQKYVRTTRINVQPEYNWDNNASERKLIGYYVSRQVEVDLRDLDKLGRLLERSFDIGVNQVGEPRLDSSKRRDLEREALAKAVADARLNAEPLVILRRTFPKAEEDGRVRFGGRELTQQGCELLAHRTVELLDTHLPVAPRDDERHHVYLRVGTCGEVRDQRRLSRPGAGDEQ